MRDILDPLVAAWREGKTVGLATVVRTFKSAPRDPGASMLVDADGAAVGSVSGGCVESAVYGLATEAIEGAPPALERYGISDDDAYAVGLTCGGILDVFVERVSRTTFPELGEIADDIAAGRPVAVATVIEHVDPARVGLRMVIRPDVSDGTFGSPDADRRIADDVRGLLSGGITATLGYGPDGERLGEGMRVFVNSFAPAPRLIVFGAIDFASALAKLGGFLGYHVTVCDARPVFATSARFPDVDELVVRWPDQYLAEQIEQGSIDERTVLCVLTHDPKFDVPVLKAALRGPRVAYIGAMGSRRTHADRVRRLLAAGLEPAEIDLVHSPIGLDLGARTPEETAVSIAAQMIQLRWGGSGAQLSKESGPIHRAIELPTEATPLVR
ncbi:XshC-Cox1 family protein [Agromyces protaetiae]|uniref:XshC-Cox1 family protein n=1 Tax=Agromyces protaetiae TaxID=2509455 RepID=A0A4P6F9W1_9MICO|nr:XdhC/CoxI family protein [Agromyces protaetiae]QAY72356.1 XshC-Cox1 family protein [Agromyces protaetiae]